MDKKNAIAIIGGGLIKEDGNWRTTNFNEGDEYGALGDRLRVAAGSILYKKNPDLLIIASGGKGQLEKIPDAIPVSEVVKQELVNLGVKPENIISENKSGNSFEQLQNLQEIIAENNLGNIKIISNKYHLPRIKAMAEIINLLDIELLSAEDILLKYDNNNWKDIIEKAYNSKAMKERIFLEEKGVKDIREGNYKFK
ncbi:MAG: YdcF family protein [Candidatus Falkowbacteria bacterium]